METIITEQFEDESDKARAVPPMIKAPVKPTHDEWEHRQVTHTPYAPWCPHCLAARNARRGHPTHGCNGRIVQDTESGEGPSKVSVEHLYLHERVGKHRDIQHNLPYMIVVEHKIGRCWAHRAPNKAINDGAYWVPRRVLQDIENSGLGDVLVFSTQIRNHQ